MSKRVANTKERTARNGRVRYGHWRRKQNQRNLRNLEPKLDLTEQLEGPSIANKRPPTLMDKVRRVFRHQKRGS